MNGTTIHRGGANTERLYLTPLGFTMPDGTLVKVEKSDIPGIDMDDLIARHIGRYGLVALYCRPGHEVLDFPCGSGYAAEFLKRFNVDYTGIEYDEPTVAYAQMLYGADKVIRPAQFFKGDLTTPHLPDDGFDVIANIEGLEHIESEFQLHLIASFKQALKPGGVLIVSSPENPTGKSGKSEHNPDHLWELSKEDFRALLEGVFGPEHVQLISYEAKLSTGVTTTCWYGICRKS
jgi:2-polyprenyl-3-methyl-5-hydroxy-6-metoxy-1,4-benzoquinol methylase